MQKITIDGVSQEKATFGHRVVITDGNNKYSFFTTKNGGGYTKAYEQFSQYGFKVGQEVQAEVKDESYTDKKGVARVVHKIIYFGEVENTPLVKTVNVEEKLQSGTKSQGEPRFTSNSVSRAEFEVLVSRVNHLYKYALPDDLEEQEIKESDLPF